MHLWNWQQNYHWLSILLIFTMCLLPLGIIFGISLGLEVHSLTLCQLGQGPSLKLPVNSRSWRSWKGQRLTQANIWCIWTQDSCLKNYFLIEPVCIYVDFECCSWCEKRPVLHLHSYLLCLKHVLVYPLVFGRESLYLVIHY